MKNLLPAFTLALTAMSCATMSPSRALSSVTLQAKPNCGVQGSLQDRISDCNEAHDVHLYPGDRYVIIKDGTGHKLPSLVLVSPQSLWLTCVPNSKAGTADPNFFTIIPTNELDVYGVDLKTPGSTKVILGGEAKLLPLTGKSFPQSSNSNCDLFKNYQYETTRPYDSQKIVQFLAQEDSVSFEFGKLKDSIRVVDRDIPYSKQVDPAWKYWVQVKAVGDIARVTFLDNYLVYCDEPVADSSGPKSLYCGEFGYVGQIGQNLKNPEVIVKVELVSRVKDEAGFSQETWRDTNTGLIWSPRLAGKFTLAEVGTFNPDGTLKEEVACKTLDGSIPGIHFRLPTDENFARYHQGFYYLGLLLERGHEYIGEYWTASSYMGWHEDCSLHGSCFGSNPEKAYFLRCVGK